MYAKGEQRWDKVLKNKYLDSDFPTHILTTMDPSKGSAIWNYILECRDIVSKHVTWEVRNGQSASF